MSTSAETKLANLLISLRETSVQATQLADQLEAAILAMYEQEESATPPKKEVGYQISKTYASQLDFKFNSNICDLVKGDSFEFDKSAKNLSDLRDYAFIEVHANSGSTVTFTYATASNYTRMCFMNSMLPVVQELLQPGKIFVVHNSKRKGKNFWDAAFDCSEYGEKHQIIYRAKKLAKLFAELKNEGKL